MLNRRSFIFGVATSVALPAVARANVVDIKWFGAIGNGRADDSFALRDALRVAVSRGQALYIPRGRYRIGAIPLDASAGFWADKTIVIHGDGADASVLESTPLNGRHRQQISGPVLFIDGARSISITDVGFDGGISAVTSPLTDSFRDQLSSLVEIRRSSNVFFRRVTTSRSMHQRSNHDKEGASFGRSGPVFLFSCSNIKIDSCRSVYPSFREGWWLINCRHVEVTGFEHRGPSHFDRFATSTPLNIFGPETEDVHLSQCEINNANGSSLNLGGRGRFLVRECKFRGRGSCTDAVGSQVSLRAPSEHGFGKGIDFGSEHQEDFYQDHPLLNQVRVESCTFESLFSYSIKLSKREWCPASNIILNGNSIDCGHRGIELSNCRDVSVLKNTMNRIVRPVEGGGVLGHAMAVSECSRVQIEGNRFIGTVGDQDVTTRVREFVPGPEVALSIRASNGIKIQGNEFIGFRRAQIMVKPRSNYRPDDVFIQSNYFRRGRTVDGALGSIVASSGARRALPGVTIADNEYGTIEGRLSRRVGSYTTK